MSSDIERNKHIFSNCPRSVLKSRGGSRGSQISHATNVKKRHIKKFGLRFN